MTRHITTKLLGAVLAASGLFVLGCENYTTEDDVKQAREEVREEQQDVQEAKEDAAANVREQQKDVHEAAKEGSEAIREEQKDVQEAAKEGHEAVREEVKEAQEAANEANQTEAQYESDQARKDFVIDREAKLKETEAQIDALEKKAADLEGAEKGAMDKQIAHVRTLQDRANDEHSRIKSTTDVNEWKTMREKCDAALNELTAALKAIH